MFLSAGPQVIQRTGFNSLQQNNCMNIRICMMLEMVIMAVFFFKSAMALKMLGKLINKGTFLYKIAVNESVLIM